jgi:tetratricopeptide (TPR) repeat protein
MTEENKNWSRSPITIKDSYLKVRKLSGKRKIATALEIIDETNASLKVLSKKGEFWFLLIKNEIDVYRNNFDSSVELLNKAFQISKTINLTSAELSSFYGRLASTQFKSENYSEAILFFENAISLTKDPPRRNYYRTKLLECYYGLKQEEFFKKKVALTIVEFLKCDICMNLESILHSVWKISQYGKEDQWHRCIGNVLISIERHQLNKDKFLIHMKKSLDFSKNVNPDFFVSMSFNYITMLENPFSDNHRAITLLEECLKYSTSKLSLRIHILNKLGSNFRFIGKYNKAIKCLEDAIEINGSLYSWLEAFSHNTLGMIYTSIGDNDSVRKALNHYKMSLEISKKNDDPYGMGYTFGALGWLESNRNLNKAKEWYDLSISTFEERTNGIPPVILLALAEILSKIDDKNKNKIDKLISQAQKQIWKTKKKLDLGRYYNTLGNISLT